MENDQVWNEYINNVVTLVGSRENYQKKLGQIASTVATTYGNKSLESLAQQVKDTAGLNISPTTLRNYRWVWEKTVELNLPEDLSYRCLQAIAGSPDPAKYAQMVDQGYSSNEIISEVRKDKGITPLHKKFICSNCGAENIIS